MELVRFVTRGRSAGTGVACVPTCLCVPTPMRQLQCAWHMPNWPADAGLDNHALQGTEQTGKRHGDCTAKQRNEMMKWFAFIIHSPWCHHDVGIGILACASSSPSPQPKRTHLHAAHRAHSMLDEPQPARAVDEHAHTRRRNQPAASKTTAGQGHVPALFKS